MKFNFDRYLRGGEKKRTLDMDEGERIQDNFEQNILKEAGKLVVSLEQLKAEIDEYGGVEKFNEEFSKISDWGYGLVENDSKTFWYTKGKKSVMEDKEFAENAKRESRTSSQLAAALASIPIILGTIMSYEGSTVEKITLGALITSIPAFIKLVDSIKQRNQSKNYEHDAKKMELKMLMTDTPSVSEK